MEETTIYVELLEEGTIVFAPVPALHLGQSFYKILEHNRNDYDKLRFQAGTFVFCLLSKFSGDENLVPVAYCEIGRNQGEVILPNISRE
jgi:hypothetical protein